MSKINHIKYISKKFNSFLYQIDKHMNSNILVSTSFEKIRYYALRDNVNHYFFLYKKCDICLISLDKRKKTTKIDIKNNVDMI